MAKQNKKEEKAIQPRPPVVTVVGHIDHGKSTLLDYIRHENSVANEAGSITQHISAYEIKHQTKKGGELRVTFLDTPGHEAFHSERLRGINIADVAILIVAADDGVKEQTKESIKALKEHEIPFVVAINKIDVDKTNIEKVKQELAENEVYLEGYGGQISFVPISAKTGEGVHELLEIILLTAEIKELEGDLTKNASGIVLESNINPKKGISATLIIKDGSIKKGMFVVAEDAIAPVRIMEDFVGQAIDEASFSTPISIIGFKSVPQTGAYFETFENKKEAEKAISHLEKTEKNEYKRETKDNRKKEEKTIIPISIKADVTGSLEAIKHELEKISYEALEIKIIQKGLGDILEGDVNPMVNVENAIILGFNVDITSKAREAAKVGNIKIESFNIIYDLIDWVQEVIKKMRPKKIVEEITGDLKIKKIFTQNKDKQVIGGIMKEGFLLKNQEFKILRRSDEIGRGIITNLQQQKADTEKVEEENECGLQIQSKIEVTGGDILEGFKKVEK